VIRGGPRSRAVPAGAGFFYEVSRATASPIGQPTRGMPSNFTLSENRIPGRSGRPPLTPLPGARLLTRYRPGYGCSPGIATHGPRPREGAGEERRRRGRGGAIWITVSGELETGEGEQVPPPRRPHPQWRYHPGPVYGENHGKGPDTVAHRLHPGHGFPPGIATHGPRPREGAGEERLRRGWGGGCRGSKVFGA